MKLHTLACTLLALILLIPSASAQPHKVSIGKKSDWLEPVSYDVQARPDNAESASSYYLLLDEQENTLTEETFMRGAYIILTSEGLQDMADMSVDFDPAYEQLIFHEVKVVRGDKVINHLQKNIQVIQREQSMDRYLYDGTKTAIINLKDIRVGDIVEYSYTRKGYNPIHKNHIDHAFYFDFYSSVDKYYKRLVVPASRKLSIKTLGEDVPAYTLKSAGSTNSYEWSIAKITASEYDYNTPAWYNRSKVVMISDFESWTDVGVWAKELFVVSEADRNAIKNNIASTFKSADDEAYILEVIRFVQDHVRYLGFEGGINGYKPHSPVKVYEQRFGDCKDKSLLLTSLLEARGIEAHPMLINTSYKHQLKDRLPGTKIFNHCVVQIIYNGQKINIDPTWSQQGGDLNNYSFPNYGVGLVLDNDIAGLDSLVESKTPTITELQDFEIDSIGGEAKLTVRTMYTGSSADYQRAEFARSTLESIQDSYKQYYANLYPKIVASDTLAYTDNRSNNVFTVEEKYTVPDFWLPLPNEESKVYCTLQPLSITTYFDVPKNIQQRKAPFALSYPLDFYHHINVSLPVEWTVVPVDDVIESEYYLYEHTIKLVGRDLSNITHYQIKRDHIPVSEIPTYVADHTKMYNGLVYQLTHDQNVAAAADNWIPGMLTGLITTCLSVLVMFLLYRRYNPKPVRYMVQGLPINGWLVLLAIGVVLTPVRLLIDVAKNPDLYFGSAWFTWLSAKQYFLFGYALVSQIYNIFKVSFSVLLVILLFKRRTSFPLLMIIQIGANLVLTSADLIISNTVDLLEPVSAKDMIAAIVGSLIWIPYLLMSQRVKETFVIRNDDDGRGEENQVEETVEMM
jgi:transglutaminase-like putative cysteine protease